MASSQNLDQLLKTANPVLDPSSYVFVCLPATYGSHVDWQPIASFAESEGLTLVVRQEIADTHGLKYDGVFRRITLTVHSSLHAVGFTAGFSAHLADNDISANVFAAYHHDHVFVPVADAARAMSALAGLAER